MAAEERGVRSVRSLRVWIMNTICEMNERRTRLAVQSAARVCRGENDWDGGERTAGARTVNWPSYAGDRGGREPFGDCLPVKESSERAKAL